MNDVADKSDKLKNKTHKLSDTEFWSVLRENGGLYARTARAIEKKYKITFGRAAVKNRAERKPELLADITEEAIDVAEEGLQTLMRTGSPGTRLEAIKFFLRYKAKDRGYGEKPIEIAAAAIQESVEQKPMGAGLKLTIKVLGANE